MQHTHTVTTHSLQPRYRHSMYREGDFMTLKQSHTIVTTNTMVIGHGQMTGTNLVRQTEQLLHIVVYSRRVQRTTRVAREGYEGQLTVQAKTMRIRRTRYDIH